MKSKTNISVVSNTGTRRKAEVIIGDNGKYPSGDILDANAVQQTIKETAGDLDRKEDKMSVVAAPSAETLSAEMGKYYRFTQQVDRLTITLPTPNTTDCGSIVFFFSTSANPTVTFSSQASILYQNGFSITGNKTYEINCLWNGNEFVVAMMTINML